MIRETLAKREAEVQNGFRLRGLREVSRVEALSDGVFAFAITLLVVSLEVPRTFDELLVMMRGFFAFAVTFAMLFHVWHTQYKFFRRYGLNDNFTIWMTGCLLFVILFYVYPLKFVWTFLANLFIRGDPRVRLPDGQLVYPVGRDQTNAMMIVYGLGFVAVFAIFALLYWHAYRRRGEMELSELEIYDTKVEAYSSLLYVAVGLLSVGIAALHLGGRASSALSGMIYALLGPVHWLHGRHANRRRKRIERGLQEETR